MKFCLVVICMILSLPVLSATLSCELNKDGTVIFSETTDRGEIVTPKFKNRDGSTIYFYTAAGDNGAGKMYYATEEKIVHRDFQDGGHFYLTMFSWESYFMWCEIKQ